MMIKISILAFSFGIIYAAGNFAYASMKNNNDERIKALKWMMIYIAGLALDVIVAKL